MRGASHTLRNGQRYDFRIQPLEVLRRALLFGAGGDVLDFNPVLWPVERSAPRRGSISTTKKRRRVQTPGIGQVVLGERRVVGPNLKQQSA